MEIDIEQWEQNAEEFIETEDDLHFTKESNMERDYGFNVISITLIDKLFQFFPQVSIQWLHENLEMAF